MGVSQGEDGRLQGRIWGGAPSSGLRGPKERLVLRTGGEGDGRLEVGSLGLGKGSVRRVKRSQEKLEKQ